MRRTRPLPLGGHPAQALRFAAVVAAYYGAGRCGLLLEVVRGQVTPLWPPTGIAVAALLLWGLRLWPAVALGAVLVNWPYGPSLWALAGISTGNTLAPVCAVLLLRRVCFSAALGALRDALSLVFLGALTGMLVSATVGTAVLAGADALRPGRFWATWSVWWTGDAMGVLLVTPLLLVLFGSPWPRRIPAPRWAEAAALAAATAAVTLLATRTPLNLPFLVFPVLIWAAYRFQVVGGVACALLMSVLAVPAADAGTGPFAGHDVPVRMLILQALNGSAALTSLVLATVVAQRDRGHEEIARVCVQLSELIGQLTLLKGAPTLPAPAPREPPVAPRSHGGPG
ncbi:MASE1 domain-containing protein [Streptomyces sp. G45]|uniref:MASE1 domain-containing protein n=1 Tax=Streptomyces sp. G45 TaxID=3406627 RepID=UPI003C20CFED